VKTVVALALALLMAVAPALSAAPAPAPACATTAPACCENCANCCAQSSVPQRGEQAPIPAKTLTQLQIQLLLTPAIILVATLTAQDAHSVLPASTFVCVPSVPLFVRHCSYLV